MKWLIFSWMQNSKVKKKKRKKREKRCIEVCGWGAIKCCGPLLRALKLPNEFH